MDTTEAIKLHAAIHLVMHDTRKSVGFRSWVSERREDRELRPVGELSEFWLTRISLVVEEARIWRSRLKISPRFHDLNRIKDN